MPITDLIESSAFYRTQALSSFDFAGLIYQFASVPFNMQAQTQTNWCWAATSTSVSHFYSAFSSWTQCRVANGELGLTGCCNSPVPGACNVPWYLDRALTRTSNFDHMVSGTITYAAILSEIRAGRVIGARQGWSGGGGHFMVIHGCSRTGSTRYLDIDDPIYGKSTITYDTFASNYQGSGTWTHTYFTKRRFKLWFDLQPIPEFVIKWIDETDRLRHLKKGLDIAAFRPEFTISVPHHVFVTGLDSAAKGRLSEVASGLRVLQLSDKKLGAMYEFDTEASAEPALQSVSEDENTNAILARGLEVISKLTGEYEKGNDRKNMPELRYLKIPALYLEGFWLHGKDGKKDVIVLTRGGPQLKVMEPLAMAEFMKVAQAEAKARLAASKDDMIAP